MLEMEHTDKDKDYSDHFTIEVPRDKLHIKKEYPYGFWKISSEKGRTPKMLRGSFTSRSEARRAVDRWVNSNRHLKVLSEEEK